MRLYKYLLLLLVGVATNVNIEGQPQPGHAIDSIFCSHKPDQSYALYLPTNYNPSQKWPAIFVFEPAARGLLALKKYIAAAEEIGYIVLASNNSKNGSWDLVFEAADAMFVDAFEKYSLDVDRVYTSGFSGGSRSASAIAALTGKIDGIIACGAGFSINDQYQLKKGSDVYYAAIVGDQDMNFLEHKRLREQLNLDGIANTLIVFNGGHRWPDSKHILEALYWIELQRHKNNQIVSNKFHPDSLYHMIKGRADSLVHSGDFLTAVETYEQLHSDFTGTHTAKGITSEIENLRSKKEYKKQSRKADRIYERETAFREKMSEAFTELYFTQLKNDSMKDMAWWRAQIKGFKSKAESKDLLVSNMGKRMLNMIWARAAESSFNYINLNEYETAKVLTQVWLETNDNLWGKWNMAIILAHQNDLNFFNYLIEVAKASKNLNPQTIQSHPAFEDYLEYDQMREVLSYIE